MANKDPQALAKSPEVSVRKATRADCRRVFDWRNHPQTYQFFFSQKPVQFEQHYAWFEQILQSNHHFLLIGLDASGAEVGVIRFDLSDDRSQAEVHLYVAPGLTGRGLGRSLLRAGILWLGQHTSVERITAKVMEGNLASHRLFESGGFLTSHRVWELCIPHGDSR